MSKTITIPGNSECPETIIDIDDLHPWANWLAVDENGDIYQYEYEPETKSAVGVWSDVEDGAYCLFSDLPIIRHDWQTLKFKIKR